MRIGECMYVPGTDTFDLFSPCLFGIDLTESELYEEPFDIKAFHASTRGTKDVSWRRLPTGCAGDAMSGEWLHARAIVGTDDDCLVVAQTLSGKRGNEDMVLDRRVRTDGIAHECLLSGSLPDKSGNGHGVSVSVNASVRPGSCRLSYRYDESFQVFGPEFDLADTARRITSSQARLNHLVALSAPKPVLSNERELLGRYRRKMSDLAGVRVSDAASLVSVLLTKGFSDDDLKEIVNERMPNRFYRFSSWSLTVGSHGTARISVKSETGTFLHGPPATEEEHGAWIETSKSFADGTARLGTVIWQNRDALLRSAEQISP